MNKIINRIRQELDLSELKGDPLEDIAKLLRFLFVFAIVAITVLIIKGLIWIIQQSIGGIGTAKMRYTSAFIVTGSNPVLTTKKSFKVWN